MWSAAPGFETCTRPTSSADSLLQPQRQGLGAMRQLPPRNDHSLKSLLRQLDRMAGEADRVAGAINPYLMILAVGLFILNLTCLAALGVSSLPITRISPDFVISPSPERSNVRPGHSAERGGGKIEPLTARQDRLFPSRRLWGNCRIATGGRVSRLWLFRSARRAPDPPRQPRRVALARVERSLEPPPSDMHHRDLDICTNAKILLAQSRRMSL